MKTNTESRGEAMRLHIEACNKSGLTVSEYCSQNNIVKSNYYYWVKKLKVENKASCFTAINVMPGAAIEITYPNGVQLCFTGEINTAVLKALVCCI